MSGRRSHVRFAVSPPSDAVVRISQDVLIQSAGGNEFVVITSEAVIVEDRMTLAISESSGELLVDVRVAESRPIIVDGAVRHLVRLTIVGSLPGLTGDARTEPKGSQSASHV